MSSVSLGKVEALLFPSELGWVLLEATTRGIRRLQIGFASPAQAQSALGDGVEIVADKNIPSPTWKEWRSAIQDYAAGRSVDLKSIPIDDRDWPEFHRAARRACRAIPRGKTVSYKELARRAGSPDAARAAGQAMAQNPVPLLVPCHRVVASGGKLGGFSARDGVNLKRRLLELEGALPKKKTAGLGRVC
jgi:methylated-DNA-[protein]-cysteine S-methyltransferase